jgi:hypothetical protein
MPVTESAADTETQPHWATVCLGCGARLAGPFCSACGQRAIPPYPTVRQLAHDVWTETVGWDGTLARTFRSLLLRPGELTVGVLEGRRSRFISPIRLYLACSFVAVTVSALASAAAARMPAPVPEASVSRDVLSRAIANGLQSLSPEERAQFDRRIAQLPGFLRPIMRAGAEDARSFQRRARTAMSRTIVVLVPALALVLGLFHWNRRYLAHLYFAIHLQAFAFIVTTLYGVTTLTYSMPVVRAAQVLAAAWIVAYAVVAQRRVYGGSWGMCSLKAIGVSIVYGALWVAIGLGVALWTAQRAA